MGAELSYGLAGRRAIVTGHRGGIGGAIHDVLARDGVEVIGLDLPDFDLSDTATLESRLAALLAERGPVDILVNNAGVTVLGSVRGNLAGGNRTRVPRQLPRRLRPDARGAARHGGTPPRRDRQHRLRPGADRQAGQRRLRRVEGRDRPAFPVRRIGLGEVRHSGELHRTRQHRHGDAVPGDRRSVGQIPGPIPRVLRRRLQIRRPPRPLRRPVGNRRRGGLPGLRRRLLHHRRDPAGRWRRQPRNETRRRHRRHQRHRPHHRRPPGNRGLERPHPRSASSGVPASVPRLRRGRRRPRARRLRRPAPGRCAGELCRDRRRQPSRWRRHAVARHHRFEPARHLPLLQGGVAPAAGRHRPDRQHRLGAGAARRARPDRLLRRQARGRGLHPSPGLGGGPARDHGQRAVSGLGGYRHGGTALSPTWASPRRRPPPASRPGGSPRRRRLRMQRSGCCGRNPAASPATRCRSTAEAWRCPDPTPVNVAAPDSVPPTGSRAPLWPEPAADP